MKPDTIARLLSLNLKFYQNFGPAFAKTRLRIQPGVRRALTEWVPHSGRWLDLGCGSGALGVEWAASGRQGLYLGIDSSEALLDEARRETQGLSTPELEIRYEPGDLAGDWSKACAGPFNGVLCFAALHHLPGEALRVAVIRQVRGLMPEGGLFIHSNWQFQHSPKLLARVQPWERIGLVDADVDEGDTLLDWRYALPGQPEQVGLRYVHRFTPEELGRLAELTGFKVVETYESDGQGGRLGHYEVWKKG
ncbi:protein containg methyltransferase domain [Longilinea arvoryzae]|uniref:Protein containg methyltransferase domain n=1 Tax=Longilinea arvoryzae TaxID=360412 RepID=A0A0S7B6N7_9CHLR|nr:class I SAM-dependent methyltransferase [Longilinea arvoryzae]GAP12847.1 protein containg methyltransferase domain [Longilinea arvoryzae]